MISIYGNKFVGFVYILGDSENKKPLNDFSQSNSGFDWLRAAEHLYNSYIVLRGVYIDSYEDVRCLQWFLMERATVISDSEWCVGEEGADEISHLPKRKLHGFCSIGSVILQGFSGMVVSDSANEWLRLHKPSRESMEKYKSLMENIV